MRARTINGSVRSSPAIVDDKVFVGSSDKNVYVLNATTGKKKIGWNYTTDGAVESSPAVVDNMVFVGSMNGTVYALRANGLSYEWSSSIGGAVKSSPAVADGKVFLGSDDGYVYALNATKRQQIWREKIGNRIKSSPAVADDTVFVCSDNGTVFAYSITGNLIWSETIGSVGWSSPAVAECKVFVGSKDGKIYALHEEDGTEVWSYQTGGPVDSSPAVLNDTLYVASKSGMLYAFWGQTHDVAVIVDTPNRNEIIGVAPNGTVNIIITLENQGSYDETNINVAIYYFNTTDNLYVANSTIVDLLLRHNKEPIELQWNTTGVAEGDYIISANATLATDEDRADNYFIGGNVTIGLRPDINVTDVWPGYNVTDPAHRVKTVVGQNYTVTIYVTVKNEGNLTATDIDVTSYWSNSLHINQTIGSAIIDELLENANETISIPWNTTGLAKGTYTITAYAWPVLGETDTTDNNFIDGTVYISIPGDINADEWVDQMDLYLIALAYGTKCGDAEFIPERDVNGNCLIDQMDLYLTGLHYGEHGY